MTKSTKGLLFVIIFLVTSITFAQSFFSKTPSPPPTPTTTAPTPLSAEEFRNLVKQQSKHAQKQENQQATQQISSKPFTLPQSSGSTKNPVAPVAPTTPPENATTPQADTVPVTATETTTENKQATDKAPGFSSTIYGAPSSSGSSSSGSGSNKPSPGLGIQY